MDAPVPRLLVTRAAPAAIEAAWASLVADDDADGPPPDLAEVAGPDGPLRVCDTEGWGLRAHGGQGPLATFPAAAVKLARALSRARAEVWLLAREPEGETGVRFERGKPAPGATLADAVLGRAGAFAALLAALAAREPSDEGPGLAAPAAPSPDRVADVLRSLGAIPSWAAAPTPSSDMLALLHEALERARPEERPTLEAALRALGEAPEGAP